MLQDPGGAGDETADSIATTVYVVIINAKQEHPNTPPAGSSRWRGGAGDEAAKLYDLAPGGGMVAAGWKWTIGAVWWTRNSTNS